MDATKINWTNLLARIEALLVEFGPQLVSVLPQIEADLVAKNYVAALLLIVNTIAQAQKS